MSANDEQILRIATYNVNFGTFFPGAAVAIATAELVLAALDSLGELDVLLLQETNDGWQAWLSPRLAERGFELKDQAWHSPNDSGYYAAGSAVAVHSGRASLVGVSMAPTSQRVAGSYFDQQVACVRRHSDGLLVAFANVHLRPPLAMGEEGVWANVRAYLFDAPAVHAQEVGCALEHAAEVFPDCQRHVVCGDFNESSGGALAALRAQGFFDGHRVVRGDRRTWFWPVGWLWLSGEYDHIMVRPAQFHVRQCRVLGEYWQASDHCPVYAQLVPKHTSSA